MSLIRAFGTAARFVVLPVVLPVVLAFALAAGSASASAAVNPLDGGSSKPSAERSGAAKQQRPDCRIVSYGVSYGMSYGGDKPAAAGAVSQDLVRCIDDAVRRYGEGVVISHYNGSHLVQATFQRAAIYGPDEPEPTEAHRPPQGMHSCATALRSVDDFDLLASLAARNHHVTGNEGFSIDPDMTLGGCVEGMYRVYSIVGPHVWGSVIFSDGRGGVVVVTIRYIGDRNSAPVSGPGRKP